MTALFIYFMVSIVTTIIFRLVQVAQGEHTHEIHPTTQAIGLVLDCTLMGVIIYAFFNWI